MWCWPLTSWLGDGVWLCQLMGYICAKYEANKSNRQGAIQRKQQNINLDHPCDLDLWPENVHATITFHGMNVWSNRQRARERTQQKLWMTMWPWAFDLKMVHDTLSPHRFYLCHLWSESAKVSEEPGCRHGICDLNLSVFDFNSSPIANAMKNSSGLWDLKIL